MGSACGKADAVDAEQPDREKAPAAAAPINAPALTIGQARSSQAMKFKYKELNRLMRFLSMSLGVLENYQSIGTQSAGPSQVLHRTTVNFSSAHIHADSNSKHCNNLLESYFRTQQPSDVLVQTHLLAQNLLERLCGPRKLCSTEELQHLLSCIECLSGCIGTQGSLDPQNQVNDVYKEAFFKLRNVQDYFMKVIAYIPLNKSLMVVFQIVILYHYFLSFSLLENSLQIVFTLS